MNICYIRWGSSFDSTSSDWCSRLKKDSWRHVVNINRLLKALYYIIIPLFRQPGRNCFLPGFRTPDRQDLFSGQDFEKKNGFWPQILPGCREKNPTRFVRNSLIAHPITETGNLFFCNRKLVFFSVQIVLTLITGNPGQKNVDNFVWNWNMKKLKNMNLLCTVYLKTRKQQLKWPLFSLSPLTVLKKRKKAIFLFCRKRIRFLEILQYRHYRILNLTWTSWFFFHLVQGRNYSFCTYRVMFPRI